MSKLLIQFSHIFKSFGLTQLFNDISLSVHQGDVFALIGENGAGKTTLLQLLRESILPDSGHFIRASHLTIGYLPQEIFLNSLMTPLMKLEEQMESCLNDPKKLTEWGELHERYEQLGGYRQMPMEKVLKGLKLDPSILDLPIEKLSSGQKVRVALAKALIENPDLLLLDEPTNHLDEEMRIWLENTLQMREGATIIVSHDRAFLNETCNRLIEIKNGKLMSYSGNYDFYLKEKNRLIEEEIKAYEAQKEEKKMLKKKIKEMTFSKRKAALSKDQNKMSYDHRGESQQKSEQRMLDVLKARLESIEANLLAHPKTKSIKGLKFIETPLPSQVAIELEQISKAFGGKILFSHFNKTLYKGDRIILTGPNGCGKTTLLQCIAKRLPIDSGKIRYAHSVKIAYLDQEVALLPMEKTPLQYFHLSEEDLRRELHKAALGEFELLNRPFSTLSVGQRKRLMLLSLILEKPNVLLLDEPTNHLDLLTLEALESALLNFEGAILAISHDETFIKKIATNKWVL